ncbi:Fic family protein [Bifidobacterium cuniculi]|uniref:Filamentation induced by cAMP protein fic n=1 Tax=Bifidobacterium cuniculi TaxID=1688 RepID=A0A087B0K0_9BIFI|nr:Fic family protein [Bifidobacterium cuniculi]KFI64550.1 filamentation induced by cAMP protein fic [Bifidobacterium cuniculi]
MCQWKIPAMGLETHTWIIPEGSGVSRSRRSRGNGPYQSAVPIRLSGLDVDIPGELAAQVEEATKALRAFDDYAMFRLGDQVQTLGPMSAVLMRTEATSSSQIEHLTVDAKNLALEMIHESNSENAAVVVGNVRAMESSLQLAEHLSKENLLAMHRALLSAQRGFEQYAGRLRDEVIWVGTDSHSPRGASFVGPQPELIDASLDDLIAFLQRDDLPALVQCALAHAQFETIHPFVDGNGRTGRALIHAILRNKGITTHMAPPVSAGLLRQTERYFDTLTAFRAGDAAPLVSLFAEVGLFAARSGTALIDDLDDQLMQIRQSLSGVRKDAAVWKVIPHLIAQPILNTRYLQDEVALSKPQAERALRTLAEHGAITARNSAKRNVVWEQRDILDVLDGYAESLRRR